LRFVGAGDNGAFLSASPLQHLGLGHHRPPSLRQAGGLVGRFDDLSRGDGDVGTVEELFAFKFIEFHGGSRRTRCMIVGMEQAARFAALCGRTA